MNKRRTMTPADVPIALIDAAERAIAVVTTEDPASELAPRDAIRAMLAVVLPMYTLRLGAELGRLTVPCREHSAPMSDADCMRCQRYTALLGARHFIEGRSGYADALRRAALQESDDGTG